MSHSLRPAPARWLIAVFVAALSTTALSAQAADPVNGKRQYTAYCASCHGYDGMGLMPNAPKLALGERMGQPDFALVNTLKSGFGTHPPFLGILNERELYDVIAYVRTLR